MNNHIYHLFEEVSSSDTITRERSSFVRLDQAVLIVV